MPCVGCTAWPWGPSWNLCPVWGLGLSLVAVMSLLHGISVVDVIACWGAGGRFWEADSEEEGEGPCASASQQTQIDAPVPNRSYYIARCSAVLGVMPMSPSDGKGGDISVSGILDSRGSRLASSSCTQVMPPAGSTTMHDQKELQDKIKKSQNKIKRKKRKEKKKKGKTPRILWSSPTLPPLQPGQPNRKQVNQQLPLVPT